MRWQEICDHPCLRDLPFKLETDRWGHIVMSPASNRHSLKWTPKTGQLAK
jgi:hypothetical protein